MKDRDVIWRGWLYLPRVRVAVAPGCLAGTSQQRPQLCDNSAGSAAAFGMGFMLDYEAGPFEIGNRESTEVTCFTQTASRLYTPRCKALVYVCCDTPVPNPAGSQLRVVEKTALLRRAALQ